MASKIERRAAVLQGEYEKLDGVSLPLAKLLGQQFAFLESLLVGKSTILITDEASQKIQELIQEGKITEALNEQSKFEQREFRSGELGLTGTN